MITKLTAFTPRKTQYLNNSSWVLVSLRSFKPVQFFTQTCLHKMIPLNVKKHHFKWNSSSHLMRKIFQYKISLVKKIIYCSDENNILTIYYYQNMTLFLLKNIKIDKIKKGYETSYMLDDHAFTLPFIKCQCTVYENGIAVIPKSYSILSEFQS